MIPSLAYYVMALRNDFIDYCNKKLQEIGLTQGQILFLIYIGKHDQCSPKELAKNLQMDNGHATRTISKLVEQDFIIQTLNEKDKRSHMLSLTTKGKDAYKTSYDLFSQWDQEILKNVPIQEKEQLLKLMADLAQHKSIRNFTENKEK